MGHLENGKWLDEVYDTKKTKGYYIRADSGFRNWITPNGEPGPTGIGGYKAEQDRYHLYVSYACPWAHRTIIYRSLKGLEDIITMSVVHWHMGEDGWAFESGDGVVPDSVNNAKLLHQIYTSAKNDYTGRVTVPVLWDRKTRTIVSNESSEIIRMFNSAFDGVGAREGDYYPEELRQQIDGLNERIYPKINNGVYRAGFATTQEAYEEALYPLFETLDWVETILGNTRYLTGTSTTEADWRLFTTLIRFDSVYVGHFKCNIRRLVDYKNLQNYLLDLFQITGISKTVNQTHIKGHYFGSHTTLNPSGVIPAGPLIDYYSLHNRANMI